MGGFSTYTGVEDPDSPYTDWDENSIYSPISHWLRRNGGVGQADLNPAAGPMRTGGYTSFMPDDSPLSRYGLPEGGSGEDQTASLQAGGSAGLGTTQQPDASQNRQPPPGQNAPTLQRRMPPPPTDQTAGQATTPPPSPSSPVAQAAQPAPSVQPMIAPPPPSPYQAAKDRDTAILNQEMPKAKGGVRGVLQRLALAALSDTKLAGIAQQIAYPELSRELAQRQRAANELGDIGKLEETEARAREAQQQGQYYEGLERGRQEERRITAQGRIDAAAQAQKEADLKRQQGAFDAFTHGRMVVYRPQGDTPPQGWEAIPLANPSMPQGYVAYAPSTISAVPKELLPYLPGRNEGDMIPRDEFDAASKSYREQIEKNNTKPDVKLPTTPSEVLLNPGKYTPEQVAQARSMFAQEHRPPDQTNHDFTQRSQLLKTFQPANDSASRFNIMAQNYDDAIKNHDQQAMLSLLTNHIGMTLGAQKGGRITKDVIHEAIQSRPWLQGLESKVSFDHGGLLSGVTLTPPQMAQMVGLARSKFAEDVSRTRNEAAYLGAKAGDEPARTPNQATMLTYLRLANGNVNNAKAMATQDGWTVQ